MPPKWFPNGSNGPQRALQGLQKDEQETEREKDSKKDKKLKKSQKKDKQRQKNTTKTAGFLDFWR